MNSNAAAIAIAIASMLLTALAERLHLWRCDAVARLAFGPLGAPRGWTKGVPAALVLASGLLGWGFTVLAMSEPQLIIEGEADSQDEQKPEDLQRVIILLDVSPSMNIADAGERKDRRRRDRILDVTEGICSRIALGRTRFSVIAFFTSARPVVVDTSDISVIRNVLDNLPLVWSFEPGETNLLEAIKGAADLARDWPTKSTTLFICTDGDTTDFSRIPPLPRSIHKVDILAVGDPVVGTFINNHDSRQQAGILRRLAAELGGSYYDVNTRHIPSSALTELSYVPPKPSKFQLSMKDVALLAVALGSLLLIVIPIALEFLGSSWHAAKELPNAASDQSEEDEDEQSHTGARQEATV